MARFLGVLATNLILSGDNAVVIAMAGRRLRGSQRKKAIFWGAVGAVGLRMVFALVITFLLAIPFVQVLGGLLLFWIAWQLARSGEDDEDEEKVRAGRSVWDAVKIIIAADAVMSLDNVIALVGVSGGNLWLLGIGLALTIPLVVWGATLLSALLDRWPILVYAGAGLLAWVALGMIFEEGVIHGVLAGLPNGLELGAKLAGTGIFVAFVWLWPPGGRSGGIGPS
jgi:YjbE family integral membrane protein